SRSSGCSSRRATRPRPRTTSSCSSARRSCVMRRRRRTRRTSSTTTCRTSRRASTGARRCRCCPASRAASWMRRRLRRRLRRRPARRSAHSASRQAMSDPAPTPPGGDSPERRLSFAFAKRHGVLVNRVVDGVAECTYRDTATPQALAEVRRYLRRSLRLERVPEERFDELLRQAYEAGSDAMQAVEGLDDTTDLAHLAQELPEQAD